MTNHNQKKVFYLITKANWGGAQRYVYDLATNLDKDKFTALVISGEAGTLTDALSHQQVHSLTLPCLNNSLSPKDVLETIKNLYTLFRKERPDIIHVNSSVAGGIGAFVGRLARVPKIVFTAHGWAFNEKRSLLAKAVFFLLHYLTVLLSHHTIAVSRALANQLPMPGTKKRIKILYPGRTIGVMFDKNDARATLIQDFPFLSAYDTDIWVGSIAELHPIKQHDILIRSFVDVRNTYPNTRLIIIGAGEEKDKLENLIRVYGLEENVFLLGAIYEAARLLKAFDLFALASHSEAYGYVLHEAGIASLPTVATNVGGIPEIITHEVNGLLVPDKNPTELSRSIIRLLSEPKLAQHLAEAHHERMIERNLENMVKATEGVYAL